MKKFKKFEITSHPFNGELLSGILWQLDLLGINEEENKLIVYAGEKGGVTRISLYSLLENMTKQNLIEKFDIVEELLEDKNWNEEWEKNVNVIEVTDRIVIKPSFKEYKPGKDQVIIEIDPKMSFGTGEHQTTKLVLIFLEKYLNRGDSVLDVGCGTGIIAITAAKLGAGRVLGIDNDEWCLINGNENVVRNDVNKTVEIKLTEINQIEERDFDLILANINKSVLMNIGPQLKFRLKNNGLFILSGLLDSDEMDIREYYKDYCFEFIDRSQLDEWLALVFKLNI